MVSDRIGRLRAWHLGLEPSVCHERAEIVTECYEAWGGRLPPVLLRAASLAAVLDRIGIVIAPDELIVGHQASRPLAAPVFPEYAWSWVLDELDTLSTRPADRFAVPPATRERLREILPRWQGTSFHDRATAALPDEVLDAHRSLLFLLTSIGCATGHLAPNYWTVLHEGLDALAERSRARLAALDLTDPDALRLRDFLTASVEVARAAVRFAHRHAELAEKLAEAEREPARRVELLAIARICRRVPAQPARTFREALQSFWFLHLIIQIEANGHSISPGRFDQYLWPFYEADLAAGRMDPGQAVELLGCLWVQFNGVLKLRDATASRGFGGYPVFQNLIVGGQDRQGRDATNRLSYLCLATTRHVRLPQPSLSVRLHPASPPELVRAAAGIAATGLGMPAFFNDAIIVPMLQRMGVPLEEARDYAEVGCVEPQSPGRTNGYYPAGFLNLGKVVTLALNRGRDPLSGRQLGTATDDPLGFESYAEVAAAFDEQLRHAVRRMVTAINILDRLHAEYAPNPFVSLLVEECWSRGRCYEEGGAVYNYTAPNTVGLANAADALMAVRRLVFEERRLGMADLCRALADDFAGREDLRLLLLNGVSKYGNDDDEVDELARDLATRVLREFKAYRNGRGGRYEPGLQSISAHALFREAVAATPDGRTAAMLLADGGISPGQGRDRLGPTAVIRSAAKLDHLEASNGTLLNIKLSPHSVAGDGGLDNLAALVRTYFELGGQHVQFNVVDSAVLRDAQRHPEQHRDLVVRVAGFSVRFTTIDPVLQEDIIARTEHAL